MFLLQIAYLMLVAFLAAMARTLQSAGVIGAVASVAFLLPITSVIIHAVQTKLGRGKRRSYYALLARTAIIAGLNTALALIASGPRFGPIQQTLAGGLLLVILTLEAVFCIHLIVELGIYLYGNVSIGVANLGVSKQPFFHPVLYRRQFSRMIFTWVVLFVIAIDLLANVASSLLLSGLELTLTWLVTILILNEVGDVVELARPRLLMITEMFGKLMVIDLLLSTAAFQNSEFLVSLGLFLTALQVIAMGVSVVLFLYRVVFVLKAKRSLRRIQKEQIQDLFKR